MASKIVEDMSEDFLICSICMGSFKAPKMLPCTHSFCEECLQKYVSKQEKKDQLTCPTCRAVSTLPDNGVGGLPTNFHVIKLAEKVHLLERITSSECTESKAEAFCSECDSSISSKCHDEHSSNEESHTVCMLEKSEGKQSIEERQRGEKFCKHHPSQKLSLYCMTCCSVICEACTTILHSKPHHESVNMEDQFEVHKKNLEELFGDSKEQMDKGVMVLRKGTEGLKLVNEKKECIDKELTVLCKQLVTEMRCRFSRMKEDVLQQISDRANPAEIQTDRAQKWIREMKNIQDQTQTILQNNDPVELFTRFSELSKLFEALKKENEALYIGESELKHDISFRPSEMMTRLGELYHWPADVVVSDNVNEFFLLDFNKANSSLNIFRSTRKDLKVKHLRCFEWPFKFRQMSILSAAVHGDHFLYVGLGMGIVRFALASQDMPTIQYCSEEDAEISSMAFCSDSTPLYCVDSNNGVFSLDQNLTYRRKIVLPPPSAVGRILGGQSVIYCNLGENVIARFFQPFNSTAYNDGMQVPVHIANVKQVPELFHGIIRCNCGGDVVFLVYKGHKLEKSIDTKNVRWGVQEFCTNEQKVRGTLEITEDGINLAKAAILCTYTGDRKADIVLCDDFGKMFKYKRGAYTGAPVPYMKA